MRDNSAQTGLTSPSIAIVGAGIIGLSIALHLLENDAGAVTILERTGIGAGASGIQPGGVRQQWSTRLNCRMAQDSYAFYRDFAQRVPATAKTHLDACGYIFVADTEDTVERLTANIELQQELGIPSRLIEPQEASTIAPALNPDAFRAAAFCSDDGYFDRPQAVVEAFAEAVTARGGTIERADIRSLEPSGSRWRLLGAPKYCERFDAVVIAAGYDAPALVATLGIELPIAKRPRYLFFSEPIRERLLEPLVIGLDRGIAVKQLANGRVLASDLSAGEDASRSEANWRARIRTNILELLPLLEFVSFPIMVEGFYDMTPDAQPIVDSLAEDRIWVAAGFSGHGFMIAPTIGRLVANAICGTPLPSWAEELRLTRLLSAAEVENQLI